jgi:hypothetical protein
MFKDTLDFADDIKDISDQLTTNKQLFAADEKSEEFRKKKNAEEKFPEDIDFDASNIDVQLPDSYGPDHKTGRRSEAYDFLLLDKNQED